MNDIVNIIDEDDHVEFEKYEDLSYYHDGDINAYLYHKDMLLGPIPIWTDNGCDIDDGHDYLCINHTIKYLHDLTRRTLEECPEKDHLKIMK